MVGIGKFCCSDMLRSGRPFRRPGALGLARPFFNVTDDYGEWTATIFSAPGFAVFWLLEIAPQGERSKMWWVCQAKSLGVVLFPKVIDKQTNLAYRRCKFLCESIRDNDVTHPFWYVIISALTVYFIEFIRYF